MPWLKLSKDLNFSICLSLLFASACLLLSHTAFFWSLESLGLDLYYRFRATQVSSHVTQDIIIVEVTDRDLVDSGRWPWPRSDYREMGALLKDLGAGQIFYDYLFSVPDDQGGDKPFADVIRRAGNIYLPFIFTQGEISLRTMIHPVPVLFEAVKGTGAAIVIPDRDGKWRRIPLFFYINGKFYEHIVLKMARDRWGMEIKSITPRQLLLGNAQREIAIPLVEGDKMMLNWQGKWRETFRHYSFRELRQAYVDRQAGRPTAIDLTDFKGRICLVAVTAAGLYDHKITPLEATYPGIGVIATALSNIDSQDFLSVPPFWVVALIIYGLALLLPLVIFSGRSGREGAFLLMVTMVLAASYIFFLNGVIISPSLPLIVLLGGYFIIMFVNSTRASIEKQNLMAMATTDGMTGLYNIRFFKEVLDEECRKAEQDPSLRFCVLICDIDHFKQLNDRFGHQAGDLVLKNVAAVLRSSVRGEDVVARYGGDEALILLRHITLEVACGVAEKIRLNVAGMGLMHNNMSLGVTVSVGVAAFGKEQADQESLIGKADRALYIAKQGGRNRVST
ncbi:MAG: diguanylate cyclase [Candidatus Omnitrophota bacterium]